MLFTNNLVVTVFLTVALQFSLQIPKGLGLIPRKLDSKYIREKGICVSSGFFRVKAADSFFLVQLRIRDPRVRLGTATKQKSRYDKRERDV